MYVYIYIYIYTPIMLLYHLITIILYSRPPRQTAAALSARDPAGCGIRSCARTPLTCNIMMIIIIMMIIVE